MKVIQKIGLFLFLIGLGVFTTIPFLGTYELNQEMVSANTKDIHQEKMLEILTPIYDQSYSSNFQFLSAFNQEFGNYNDALKAEGKWDEVIWDDYSFSLGKAALSSPVKDNPWLWMFLSIGLAVLGGLLYNLPKYKDEPEGIKNNGIFHSKMKNRGWLGMLTGSYLILFYVILYWFPAYLVNLVAMVDPLSMIFSGNPASQWFLYGFVYTLAIIVMGIRMFRKYRGNKYQQLRTASVMFFQTAFAFLIPEILVLLNQPYFDFKNIWPLDYDFFYSYQLDSFLSGGSVGMFMLIWGILLIIIGVPVFTYFFGKRWYCSWVCGCGGLAETVGDPYRQLSDKSVKSWKIERYLINGVLVLAVVMTILTIANYFSDFWLLGTVTNELHNFYGFAIGSAFAGVVGTGFYPFMGNRVWCRFGCPLAAYLGIVQRFKSRFRISTNGGQCISCGNCSTYCEMGIDVRWYAQRGQNIVRSSCVGCGVCSAVCPRGVLKLENGPEEGRINELPIIIGNDSVKINA
ncbi:4Fe-4S binding protein [Algoriphagus zhangzhouensis]|uniref:4Fe-4S binding domain-containing protein n=1 Tax=Algoriphagus zhangzhouensis TaxID=1073327 RepID=A0A1M7Z6H9_9BACT|nr:4Fe-4S binding protein [Algoriphagus zhangzhouensis]TDY49147.1 4Fe-4S binding protein [Algoriphagus zhangzhouensis]SHO60501.1 4Fe-4S binding domain-containing protein [Algoriphagus zhangzhouensis]